MLKHIILVGGGFFGGVIFTLLSIVVHVSYVTGMNHKQFQQMVKQHEEQNK